MTITGTHKQAIADLFRGCRYDGGLRGIDDDTNEVVFVVRDGALSGMEEAVAAPLQALLGRKVLVVEESQRFYKEARPFIDPANGVQTTAGLLPQSCDRRAAAGRLRDPSYAAQYAD